MAIADGMNNIFVPADSETTHQEIERLKDLLEKATHSRESLKNAILIHKARIQNCWVPSEAHRWLWECAD
jgi:hypothetical protein